jgi:hypothetical protein
MPSSYVTVTFEPQVASWNPAAKSPVLAATVVEASVDVRTVADTTVSELVEESPQLTSKPATVTSEIRPSGRMKRVGGSA